MRKQIEADAKKNNMTVPQFLAKLKEAQLAQQQAQQQGQQKGVQQPQAQAPQQQQQQQPINPGPPNPAAIAVANFLKKQDLKMRTCILNGQRKDMFKGNLLQWYSLFLSADTHTQSSEPFEPSSLPNTKRHGRRTPCFPKSQIGPPSKIHSSSSHCHFLPYGCPKSIHMKAMTTPQELTRSSALKDSGPSRLSNSRNAGKNFTSYGSMKVLKLSKSFMLLEL
jgi:translocation protein SEC62